MKKWTLMSLLFLLCLLFLLPDQGSRIHTNAEDDSDERANLPKVEDKLGAVPNGLSTDSDVVKRESESMSKKTLRNTAEKFEFQTEVSRLMDVIINSLYSNKDIFLRELISNASDALDKIRFLSLTDKEVLGEGDNAKLDISIKLDKEKKILSIRDRGIGMTKEDLIKNLGTIAKSGTSAFVEKMQTSGDLNLIGQFGVGFYSVYLVANYVEVISKHNEDKQHVWESKADGKFAISEDTWNEPLGRGTEIRLHLREEAGEYLEESKLKDLVKRYSEFINFPIYLWATKEVEKEVPADDGDSSYKEETTESSSEETEKKPKTKTIKETTNEWEHLNDVKAIWLRSPKEVTDEEYTKFYHSLAKGMETTITSMMQTPVDLVTRAFEAPFAWAVVFGVQIGGHLFVEGLLFVVILYLLSQKSYAPPKKPLTEEERDEMCEEWTPEPLIPAITREMQREPPKLESAAGPHTIINGKEVLNFASANYLGLIGHEKLLNSCTSALEKYGVGSCGPRGFYGTIDVHLDCESRIAKFLGTPDSILYSYGLSTMFSTIPAFSKKGDIIVVDEGVHWGIQNGLYLSRSNIKYFKHNDMESLKSTLEKITIENKRKQIRRYIVIEAVYQNSGQVAPLPEIIKLKEEYRFRLLMDESNSFGVLGGSGKGLTEHFNVLVEKIDIITAAMGHALAAEGGFCTGNARVIEHQRLSSSGYVFSASLPPYLASAAISAIDVLEENPNLIKKLKENVAQLWEGLSDLQGLEIASHCDSPIIFLKLAHSTDSSKNDMQLLEDIVDKLLEEHNIFVVSSKRSTLDKCPIPIGIRLFVSAGHSTSDLMRLCQALKIVALSVLSGN